MKSQMDTGISIDQELLALLEKAIELEKGQNQLARTLGVTQGNVGFWMGKGQRKSSVISWDIWPRVRQYLLDHGLMREEIRWLTPEEMRQKLADEKKHQILDELEECLLSHFRNVPDDMKLTAIKLVETLEVHIMTPVEDEELPSKNCLSSGNSAG